MKTDTHSFIIRVWYEAQDSEGNILAWRGSIDHVGSEKRLYFQDLEGIARFIQEQSGVRDTEKGPFWHTLLIGIKDGFGKLRKALQI